MRSRATILLALVALGVLPSGRVRANPPDLLGLGPRTSALGMTGTSYADDYEAAFANPALLSRVQHKHLTVGVLGGSFQLHVDDAPHHLSNVRSMTIGFAVPLPFGGKLANTLGIGAAFYLPVDSILRADILFTDEPQFPLLARTDSVAAFIGGGVSLHRLVPGLRVGLGAIAVATLVGRLDMRLTDANLFVSQTESQVLASFRPTAGVSYDQDRFGLGAMFRTEAKSSIDVDLRISELPLAVPPIRITGLAQYAPHTLIVEGHYRLAHFMLVANLTYRRFSAYPGMLESTTADSQSPPAPDFRDTVAPHAGVEWEVLQLRTRVALRGGYAFEPTPAPPARLAPARTSTGEELLGADVDGDGQNDPVMTPILYLDSNRHVLTAGFGVQHRTILGPILTLDGQLQLHAIVDRVHEVAQAGRTDPIDTHGFLFAAGVAGGIAY